MERIRIINGDGGNDCGDDGDDNRKVLGSFFELKFLIKIKKKEYETKLL